MIVANPRLLKFSAVWKTAEKVGFEKTKDYVHYYCMFDEVHHLAEIGLSDFREKQYKKAAECYEKIFAMTDVSPHYYYHLAALAWAALGERKTAVRALEPSSYLPIDQFKTVYLKSYFQLRPDNQQQLATWQPIVAAVRLSDVGHQEWLLTQIRTGLALYD